MTCEARTQADAQRIADLLEALERIAVTEELVDPLNLPGNYAQSVCGIAREAIARARGRGRE